MGTTTGTTVARAATGGWAQRRREVIDASDGVCALCGTGGSDTAFRQWDADDLLAAHTRCVVGLGPPAQVPAAA